MEELTPLIIGPYQCPECPRLQMFLIGLVIGIWVMLVILAIAKIRREAQAGEEDDAGS